MSISSNHKMTLSFKDIKGLFKHKKCKICGKRLEKVTIKKNLGEQTMYTGGTFFKGETKEYKIKYYCKVCDKMYELSEL